MPRRDRPSAAAFNRNMARRDEFLRTLKDPASPDNLEVRIALLKKVEDGEMTPAEMQAEVLRLKRQRKRGVRLQKETGNGSS